MVRPTHHKIIIGDSRRMSHLPDQSVHLVVTSPPYWQLKDYGRKSQIGFHDSYQEYINNLNLVWQECFRVLHNGCRMCINIGDQFARSVYYGRYKVIPIRTEIIKFCETIGLDYLGAVIWQKMTTTNTTGGATIMGSFPYPRNGILKIDYEFILIFKKQGKPPRVRKSLKEKSKLSTADWNTYFSGHWRFAGEKQAEHLAMFPVELPYRLIRMFSFVGDTVLDPFLGSGTTSLAAKNLNRNSIGYEINTDFIPVIKNKLKMLSKESPAENTFEWLRSNRSKQNFKTELAALPYRYMAGQFSKSRMQGMATKSAYSSPQSKNRPAVKNAVPLKALISLPQFQNHRIPRNVISAEGGIQSRAKRTGKNLKTYGSKISLNTPGDQPEYFRVTEILSPEKIKLSNGRIVRLLGIIENRAYGQESIRFLQKKTRGQQVFLKFDPVVPPESNYVSAYVYLKNRTFLNAHLLKSGFVFMDKKRPFGYRSKFFQILTGSRGKRG